MTVLAPSRSPGMGDVTVRSPTWQDGTLEMAFEFAVDPPLITSLSPVSGPQEGGTLVVIQGANFPYNPIVTFGGVAGENIAVYNNIYPTGWQTIHVLSPPGVGSVELKVENPNTVYLADDSSVPFALGEFTYEEPVVDDSDDSDPTDAADPSDPSAAGDVTDPSDDATDSTDAADATDASDSTDATDATDQADATDATDATDSDGN